MVLVSGTTDYPYYYIVNNNTIAPPATGVLPHAPCAFCTVVGAFVEIAKSQAREGKNWIFHTIILSQQGYPGRKYCVVLITVGNFPIRAVEAEVL